MRISGTSAMVGAVVAVVVAAVSIGLLIINTPGEQRALRLDERRVADLRQIARSVDLFWTRSGELPGSLDQVREEVGGPDVLMDPETSEPCEFQALNGSSYQLCAEFNRESTQPRRGARDSFWSHRQGRQCFEMEAEELER